MTVSKRDRPRVLGECWIHRDFLKEKLRVRERYFHYVSSTVGPLLRPAESDDSLVVFPDGLCWRKYLPLITQLVEQPQATRQCRFVLLESAVECMDYRNSSPCIAVDNDEPGKNPVLVSEATAVQERSKLQKLLEQHRVFGFCDLSWRSEDEDEWDSMGYENMATLERCNHALLRATSLLQHHSQKSPPKIVILSSEPEVLQQFTLDEGVELLSMDAFLHQLVERKMLQGTTLESLQAIKTRCEEAYRIRNAPPSSKGDMVQGEVEYWTEETVLQGLRNKTLVKGRLNVSKENPKEGYVIVNGGEGVTYFVNQMLGHFNRALHQDIVVLEPLDEAQWGRPVGRRRLVHYRDDDDDDDVLNGEITDASPPVPSARVVAVLEPSRRQFIATLVDLPMNDESACLVVPMDIRIPKIRIKTNAWRRLVGNRLLVQIDAWEVGNNYPAGHCVDIIGPIADLETEIQCLLHENQLHLIPFSRAALACLPHEGHNWVVSQDEIGRRLDLRSTHRIFSVDPPGCQDIDDTMHARGEFANSS